MVCFGFSSHTSHDELYIGKYKIATIFSDDEQRYARLMNKMDISLEDKIKTVLDTFSVKCRVRQMQCLLMERTSAIFWKN